MRLACWLARGVAITCRTHATPDEPSPLPSPASQHASRMRLRLLAGLSGKESMVRLTSCRGFCPVRTRLIGGAMLPRTREAACKPGQSAPPGQSQFGARNVTCPSFRPGRGFLPYRCRCAPGTASTAAGSGSVPIRFTIAECADRLGRAERPAEHGPQVVLELAGLPPPRSSSGRSCGRAGPSRWRSARRPSGRTRSPARRRSPAARSTSRDRLAGPALQCRRRRPGPGRATGAGCRPRGGSRPAGRRRSAPSRPRTAICDSSRSKATKPSRISGTPPQRPPGRARRRRACGSRPAPCRRSPAAASSAPRAGRSRHGLVESAKVRWRRTAARRHAERREQRLLGEPVLARPPARRGGG